MYVIILFFHSTIKSTEEKRCRVDMAMIKESIEKEEIIVQWISNECQLAYVLTKQGEIVTLKFFNILFPELQD